MFDNFIGKHCEHNGCTHRDYLISKCISCSKYLCKNHYHIMIECPKYKLEEPKKQADSTGTLFKLKTCSLCCKYCHESSIYKCEFCEKVFCIDHKLQNNHICPRAKNNSTPSKILNEPFLLDKDINQIQTTNNQATNPSNNQNLKINNNAFNQKEPAKNDENQSKQVKEKEFSNFSILNPNQQESQNSVDNLKSELDKLKADKSKLEKELSSSLNLTFSNIANKNQEIIMTAIKQILEKIYNGNF